MDKKCCASHFGGTGDYTVHCVQFVLKQTQLIVFKLKVCKKKTQNF